MRRKQDDAIANCVRPRRPGHASQYRYVRKTGDLPRPQLRAAATIPHAQAELGIACALPPTRARQFRGHDNPGAPKSRRAIVVAREGLESTKRLQSPSPERSLARSRMTDKAELIGGDHAETG